MNRAADRATAGDRRVAVACPQPERGCARNGVEPGRHRKPVGALALPRPSVRIPDRHRRHGVERDHDEAGHGTPRSHQGIRTTRAMEARPRDQRARRHRSPISSVAGTATSNPARATCRRWTQFLKNVRERWGVTWLLLGGDLESFRSVAPPVEMAASLRRRATIRRRSRSFTGPVVISKHTPPILVSGGRPPRRNLWSDPIPARSFRTMPPARRAPRRPAGTSRRRDSTRRARRPRPTMSGLTAPASLVNARLQFLYM